MDVLIAGALQRTVQMLAQAAPTILVGLLIAGLFRQLLGAAKTRSLFGGDTWRSLPQAWTLGMLLPVCSLGVIPVVSEMRRSGIKAGTVLAFALTAPLFNPLSLLYGLTLSDPVAILTFALCSLVIVTAVGLAFDRFSPANNAATVAEPAVPSGWRRIAAMLLFASRQALPTLGYTLIAIIGVVSLAMVLPAGSLQTSMEHENRLAPVNMVLVSVPAYATPMLAMSQVGMMFDHANSIGAAFVLLVLGTGINFGLVAWTVKAYGVRYACAWLLVVVTIVLGLGYAINAPLHPQDIEPAGHTHAFDVYCCPMHAGQSWPGSQVVRSLRESLTRTDYIAIGLLSLVLCSGMALRVFDPKMRCEARLSDRSQDIAAAGRYDIVIPGPVVAGIALTGLVVFSVAGCYYYYPAPEQALAELTIINTEVAAGALSGNRKHAEYFLPLAEDWTRRVQVGIYLRTGKLSRFQQMKARIYAEKLELLEHALADDAAIEVAKHAREANTAYHRMKIAFLESQ